MPYDVRLTHLSAYLQQLEMESNGKSVDVNGETLACPSAPVVWGGVGTSVQHAFFQALHQGTDVVPVSFVAAAQVEHPWPEHHDALIANMAAQGAALLRGRSYPEALAQERDPPAFDALCDTLAGMSNQLFVSRYQVQLPGKEQMAAFLHQAVAELGGGDE